MTKSIIFAITALTGLLLGTVGAQNAFGDSVIEILPIGDSLSSGAKAIPDWLKKSFLWYGEGKTSQEDLLNSMNWMMKQNLLHLSDEAAQEVQGLKDENRMLKEKIGIDPEGPGIVVRPVPGALPELPGFPEACPEIYDPVCGRDGRTYPNECHANEAGVGIVHDGQCREVPQRECPRGYTWIACAGICVPTGDENVCPQDHKWSEHSAQCTPDSDQCICTQEYAPVCGTDGKTYGNKCEAGCADAEIKHEGQCSAECDIQCFKYDPVCGEDGNTYGCGQPDAACHGVEVAHEGECQDDQCICTKEYVPVCGTDGNTYGNKCEAGCADAEIEYEGQCTSEQACRSNAECSGDNVCRDGVCQVACSVQCVKADPVCGEDGNTYSCGQADAACHGVEVAHEGECIAIRAMPAQ